MNIIHITLLICLLTNVFGITLNNNNFKNFPIKCVIFKKKTIPKLLSIIKSKYKIYYTKTTEIFIDFLDEYEKLSYEDKALIDFIISSIL